MVRVFASSELPDSDVYNLTRMGYNVRDYAYVAIGLHGDGQYDIENLFAYAHIVTPTPEYSDEVFHYALIGLK